MKKILIFLLLIIASSSYGQAVRYTIISENKKKRFDHAKWYVVVIAAISPAKDNYKAIVKDIVNRIAAKEHSHRFSLTIIDDWETGQMYKNSHYGEGNAILSAIQLRKLGMHDIADYTGGLSSMGLDEYELSFYLSAEKGTQYFKYRKTESYKPAL